MNAPYQHDLVLALYPNARGFAFVLFEGAFSPVDWGIVWVRGSRKNRRCVRRFTQLIARNRPDVLLLENMAEQGSRRHSRIRVLNKRIGAMAARAGIGSVRYSRTEVRERFMQFTSPARYARAEFIARHIPVFEPLLPPPRKIWNSEDARMGIFDAAALALTYFHAAADRQFAAA
jgi:hypothetical protein